MTAGEFLFKAWDIFWGQIPPSIQEWLNKVPTDKFGNPRHDGTDTYKHEFFRTFVTWISICENNKPFYINSGNDENGKIIKATASDALRIYIENNTSFKGYNKKWLKPLVEFYNDNIDFVHLKGIDKHDKIE